MVNSSIRNVVFDLGGVLINTDLNRTAQCFKALGVSGAEEMFSNPDFMTIYHQFECGAISDIEFRDRLRLLYPILSEASDQQIDSAWNAMLIDIPEYKLDLLLELRSHLIVYLLSNTNTIHWEWALENLFRYKGFTHEDFFEHEYLSFRLQKCKPEESVFEFVLSDANIDAAETFFIDDKKENTDAAEKLGMLTYTPKLNEDWSFLFNIE